MTAISNNVRSTSLATGVVADNLKSEVFEHSDSRQRRRSSLMNIMEAVTSLTQSVRRSLIQAHLLDDEDATLPDDMSISSSSSMTRRSSITAEEDLQLEKMLAQLSEDELEIAARTCYEYLKSDDQSRRTDCAKQMAKRFLRSRGCPDLALNRMKRTLNFRRDMDVDRLRLAFDEKNEYCQPLKEHLSSGMVYVSGYDKDGRSTYVFEPYRVQGHDDEWTIKQHVWTLERAIACSKSKDKTVNAVVNFNNFSVTKHAPPTHVGKQFLTTLRSHYAGHVNEIFLVDAPTAFLCLWAIFKPFIGSQTRNKIKFVSNDRQKKEEIGQWYSPDQATPWMLPNGQKKKDFDANEYLFATPFTQAFDERN